MRVLSGNDKNALIGGQMPTPNPGESRDDFVDRCIPIVLEDGAAADGDQAVAVCNSLYDQARSEATMSDTRTDKSDVDYKTLPGFETKTIPTFVKNVDEAQGIVEHIISVFGIIDDGRDIVMPGSFAKTIAEHGARVRVLDQHNYDSSLRVVGKPISIREIGRDELPLEVTAQYPAATGGVLATTQYALKTDNGRNMFALISGGYLPETSIGYDALDTEEEFRIVDGDKVAIRLLKTIRLWEYSNVIWGMNPATSTVSAKAAEPDAKTVSGATDLPIADRDRSWDAAEAAQGARRVTGSEDEPGDSYKDGFFWFDGEQAELFTSYRLPFADDVGGELTAIPRGIFAGAARLDSTAISDADKDQIRSRMSRYYARMREQFDDDSIVPPWEKALPGTFVTKQMNLSQHVHDVAMAFYGKYPDGPNGIWWVQQVWDDYVIAEHESENGRQVWRINYQLVDSALTFAPVEEWIQVEMVYIPKSNQGPSETKIASAISTARAALSNLKTALAEVERATDSDNPKAAPPGAADDSDAKGAGPVIEPPTSEADLLMIEVFKAKSRDYNTLEVTE